MSLIAAEKEFFSRIPLLLRSSLKEVHSCFFVIVGQCIDDQFEVRSGACRPVNEMNVKGCVCVLAFGEDRLRGGEQGWKVQVDDGTAYISLAEDPTCTDGARGWMQPHRTQDIDTTDPGCCSYFTPAHRCEQRFSPGHHLCVNCSIHITSTG